MKSVLKKLWLVVAIPISLAVVLYIFLRGGPGCVVYDPVHDGEGQVCDPVHPPSSSPKANTQPAPLDPNDLRIICDPVLEPPPRSPGEK